MIEGNRALNAGKGPAIGVRSITADSSATKAIFPGWVESRKLINDIVGPTGSLDLVDMPAEADVVIKIGGSGCASGREAGGCAIQIRAVRNYVKGNRELQTADHVGERTAVNRTAPIIGGDKLVTRAKSVLVVIIIGNPLSLG